MTTATQQIPSNPALDFAQSILDETNNGLELIEILRDIAEDCDEKANTNDRIAATNILNDRAFGKTPKQITPRAEPSPNTTPATKAHPEQSRRVTQIGEDLNQSLGPAPSAHTSQPVEPAPYSIRGAGPVPAQSPFDPNSIHFTIQQHILAITNNGQMLRDILLEIARAEDDPRVTPYHRRRAAIILIDRSLGTDPTPVLRAVQERPEPGQSVSHNPEYPPDYTLDPTKSCIYCSPSLDISEGHEGDHRIDHEGLAEAFAENRRLLEELGIAPPDISEITEREHSSYNNIPEDYIPNPDEIRKVVAEFAAQLDLQAERRAQWPAIEERRRKKLAQIYPSHSEEDEPPNT